MTPEQVSFETSGTSKRLISKVSAFYREIPYRDSDSDSCDAPGIRMVSESPDMEYRAGLARRSREAEILTLEDPTMLTSSWQT